MKRQSFILLALSLFLTTLHHHLSAQQFDVDTIMYHGDATKFINVVFIGDGYEEANLAVYRQDVQTVSNYIFSASPFKEYKNYFNVFAINVPSAQTGTDHPGTATDVSEPVFPVQSVNTYFNSTFDAGDIHRLLVAPNSSGINAVINQNFPLTDQVLVLVNSPEYGGSGGSRAVSSLHSSAPEIMLHEMGHSFGNLADEYYAGDQYAGERANMTAETNPGQVKWKNWMGDQGIGIYQHCCGGNSADWYRPHEGCKMRFLGTAYPFCAVCKETLIERIHSIFGTPVTAFSPEESFITVCSEPVEASLTVISPIPNTLGITWLLNGEEIATDEESLTILPQDLTPGNNQLRAEVTDNTTLSRDDDHPADHTYSVEWTIFYTPLVEPVISADGVTEFCAGEQVTLTCTSADEYLWSNGETTQSITVSTSGTYTVTISNSLECSAVSEPVSVTVNPLPGAFIEEGPLVTICPGEEVTLTAGEGDLYLWNNGATTQSIVISEPGTFIVTVETFEGCTAESQPTIVAQFSPADAAIVPDGASLCPGDSILLSTGDGESFAWSTGATSQAIYVSEAGTYSVTVTSTSGCSAVSDAVQVDVYNIGTADIMVHGGTNLCAGDTVLLSFGPFATYSWSTAETTQSILVLAPGTFEGTVTDEHGCILVADPVHLDVTIPSVSVDVEASAFCSGDSIHLTGIGDGDLLWNTGDTTEVLTISSGGIYQVTLTDAQGCTGISDLVVITEYPLPPAPVITAFGLDLYSSASDGNQWFLDGVLIPNATDSIFYAEEDGTYQVLVTDSNGCQAWSEPYLLNTSATIDIEGQEPLVVIPNPNQGTFRLSHSALAQDEISFFNMTGHLIGHVRQSNDLYDLSNAPAGVYLILLKTKEHTYRARTVIQ